MQTSKQPQPSEAASDGGGEGVSVKVEKVGGGARTVCPRTGRVSGKQLAPFLPARLLITAAPRRALGTEAVSIRLFLRPERHLV